MSKFPQDKKLSDVPVNVPAPVALIIEKGEASYAPGAADKQRRMRTVLPVGVERIGSEAPIVIDITPVRPGPVLGKVVGVQLKQVFDRWPLS